MGCLDFDRTGNRNKLYVVLFVYKGTLSGTVKLHITGAHTTIRNAVDNSETCTVSSLVYATLAANPEVITVSLGIGYPDG